MAVRRRLLRLVGLCALGIAGLSWTCDLGASDSSGWPQWGRSPQHQGAAPVAAQPLEAILADVLYDPFVAEEASEGGGQLDVHYSAPLVEEGAIYIEVKSGTYVPCRHSGPTPCGADAWNLQVWNVEKLTWQNGALVPAWTFMSDWKPEPDGGGFLSGWEPVFHPVLARGSLFVPGAGGTVFQVDKSTGLAVARINPFPTIDASTFVSGGLAADDAGNVFYNAMRLDPINPWGVDVVGAWLVRIDPAGRPALVSFSALVAGAPAATDPCEGVFGDFPPWPPSSTAVPPGSPCGSQRPGVNVIPAIASDGTIYTVSRAHFNTRYAYVLAIRPNLTPLWSTSLRSILDDGCDVLVPASGTAGGCRAGSARGVDPATNNQPAGEVSDVATSSPVVAPDGAVLIGTISGYNYFRGHLFKLSAAGLPLATYDFGWDSTPAVFARGASYSILIKDNHYAVGSYCNDPMICPPETARYDFTSLDSNLVPEWHYTNVNTLNCRRNGDGSVSCARGEPDGFEWCINQPAVDARGVVYANSEDGFLYGIGPDGVLREKIFLDLARGAAYTPVSIGPDGLVYAQNNGHLFAIGRASKSAPTLIHRTHAPRTTSFR
ncbi:MAG TPA: hypothetical protein VJA66_06315 [Thermoanaerobaculia bacterium]